MHNIHHATDLRVRVEEDSLVDRAHTWIRLVAERTATTAQLSELALRAAEQADHPAGWYPPSLTHGQAGSALLHLYAARTGLGRYDDAFGHIREAVLATQMEPLQGPGLFAGTSGLALAPADCTRDEPRFQGSLDRLHTQLADQVLETAFSTVEREVSDLDYDLVTGAAGTLAYLASVTDPTDRLREAAAHLVDYLVWLAGPATTPGTPHRWLITSGLYPPGGNHLERYPHGYLNLGFSHGVPGVAAALAVAWQAGHRRPGQAAAIASLTFWILAQRRADQYGPFWTDGTPVDADGRESTVERGHDQLAWCYGTAGVSAALLAVADATGDTVLRGAAVEAFDGVLARAEGVRLPSPTLCHGHAGLVMLCQEFAPLSPRARDGLPRLLEDLLAYGDASLPVCFADQEVPGNHVDDPTLLTGATGVALTLLSATGIERPLWLRTFLAR
ncbi:lanthionine synthetase C family protein [Streptomyces sp. NPDC059956]|uniref:lanthionine synthetase C family protein n=1 Tax=Streptomyces sp. NPDC059956 TaxID=3347015 RepID=UPI00365D4C37